MPAVLPLRCCHVLGNNTILLIWQLLHLCKQSSWRNDERNWASKNSLETYTHSMYKTYRTHAVAYISLLHLVNWVLHWLSVVYPVFVGCRLLWLAMLNNNLKTPKYRKCYGYKTSHNLCLSFTYIDLVPTAWLMYTIYQDQWSHWATCIVWPIITGDWQIQVSSRLYPCNYESKSALKPNNTYWASYIQVHIKVHLNPL